MRKRPLLLGALAWVVAIAVGRGAVAAPEHCAPVTGPQLRAAAEAAVGWFERNQLPDGRWLYRYDRDADVLDEQPHLVRHAGVTMSLYQADAAGIAGARAVADRGTAWALDQLVDIDDGARALLLGTPTVPVGATALLTAALAVRRDATGDPRYDDELDAMGRFLVSMIEPSGAVLARWDPATGRPVPDTYSTFYTGEALWALAMLATVDPDEGAWLAAARRIAGYVATERDAAEDRFPPVSDHWSAYGLAQLAAVGALPDDERSYADHLAGIFGVQVRFESQRQGDGLARVVFRQGNALGAGLGTLGEGLGSIHRLDPDDDVVAERAACAASLLVHRQVTAADAATTGHPAAAEGAWFTVGVTQKDDQQHALSALLLAEPVVEHGFATGRSVEEGDVGRVAWLALVAVVVLNPVRRNGGEPGRPAAEAAATGAVLLGATLVAPALLRFADVTPANTAMAVAVIVMGSGVVDLATRRPEAAAGRAAVPVWLHPAPTALVLGVAAFLGRPAALVTAAAVVAATFLPTERLPRPGLLARAVAAVAIIGGFDLFVQGTFSV